MNYKNADMKWLIPLLHPFLSSVIKLPFFLELLVQLSHGVQAFGTILAGDYHAIVYSPVLEDLLD